MEPSVVVHAEPDSEKPTAVIDASALLAHLNDEEGAAVVREAMRGGVAISVANWAEVLSKLAERGEDPYVAAAEMEGSELVGQVVSIEPITEKDCVAIARLRPTTRPQGLSLADRACISLAERLGVPAVTADGAWKEAEIGVEIRSIR